MNQSQVDATLEQLYYQARLQFGDAIKGYWFYKPDPCPGCRRGIDAMRYKGKDALSLNAFIYRERGVLIGYFLCGECAAKIHEATATNPGKQIPLHTVIERNLVQAYRRHLH